MLREGHGVDFFSRLMACWVFKSMFRLRRSGLLPLGGDGRGVGCWDLTQMAVIDRHVGLPLSKWRGHGVDFFSGLMGVLGFQVKAWFEEVWASPHLGRRERGLGLTPSVRWTSPPNTTI